MRKTIWLPTLLLTAIMTAPVLAGAGLPTLARIDLGSHQVQLLGDSPDLHTGMNTITMVVTGPEPDEPVSLHLVGPAGERVEVPLRPLTVVEGPDGGHGTDSHEADKSHDAADSHAAEQSHSDTDSHAAEQSHNDTDSHEAEQHQNTESDHGHASDSFQVRGQVRLNATGPWRAEVRVNHASQAFTFQVVQGGPNRLFVGASATIIAGSVLYGAFSRRGRQQKEA